MGKVKAATDEYGVVHFYIRMVSSLYKNNQTKNVDINHYPTKLVNINFCEISCKKITKNEVYNKSLNRKMELLFLIG